MNYLDFVGYKLMFQSSSPLENMLGKNSYLKEDCVITDLPDIDVLCLQEVWERYWASNLIAQLKMKYSHFIHGKGVLVSFILSPLHSISNISKLFSCISLINQLVVFQHLFSQSLDLMKQLTKMLFLFHLTP